MTTLPRCPFCKEKAVRLPDDLEKEIAVCSGCGAMESVERWQRRAKKTRRSKVYTNKLQSKERSL